MFKPLDSGRIIYVRVLFDGASDPVLIKKSDARLLSVVEILGELVDE